MDKSWGGTRKGSGRRKLEEDAKRKGYTFQLDESEISYIDSCEGSNRSSKLRKILKEHQAK